MRWMMFAAWCLMPLAVMGYHYGPGQKQVALDEVDASIDDAKALAESKERAKAIERLNEALAKLPPEKLDRAPSIRLERAKLQMLNKQLPEAFNDLQALVDELEADPKADPKLLAEAHATFANCQYYVTWLMRLEGRPREDWEPQVESARQLFRRLAEEADASGDKAAAQERREDLEATIRLARMDVGDLQGLPMPKQCQQCKSGKCNCKGKKPGKKPNAGQKPPEDARGASGGPPGDNGGN